MRILIPLILICFTQFAVCSRIAFAREANIEEQAEQIIPDQKIEYIFNALKESLVSHSWYIRTDGHELIAYKFDTKFYELKIRFECEYSTGFYNFKVTVYSNDIYYKEFKIEKERVYDNLYLKSQILTFLFDRINSDFKDASTSKKIFSSSISFGYNRTHDNSRFYPEYGEGSFYMSGTLLYDPAVNIPFSNIRLNQADYLSCGFYFAYDSRMRENFFNIDVLLYGRSKFESSGSSTKRSVYGLFNGFEYFRPGWSDRDVLWSHRIYKKKPHIQYTIWRAVQWTILNCYTSRKGVFETRFSAGLGPSINSSLTATGILEGEEVELSHIFKSIEYRKQNYYYSAALPLSAGFIADRIKDFRFEAGYDFYFFYPIENEKAFDILNVFKCSIGYYIVRDCLVNACYEYWEIESMVRDIEKDHCWNRMIMEMKFLF